MSSDEARASDPSAEWETPCPKQDDGQHCNCWYDGEACCACGDPAQEPSVWCKNCGYHVEGGLCGYDTPCGGQQ